MKYVRPTSLFIIILAIALSVFIYSSHTSKVYALLGPEGSVSTLYSSLTTDKVKNNKITAKFFGLDQQVSVFDDGKFTNHEKSIYLSPNRRLLAITAWSYEEGDVPLTYITDISGNKITEPHIGSFSSWSPDSTKVLVYRSNTNNEKGREIYVLDTNGTYYNSNLPVGVINAHFSPIDISLAYSFTPNVTDHSDIWIRDENGNNKLLLKGENDIFAWLTWSPDGSKIAFLREKMKEVGPSNRQLWVMDSQGNNLKQIISSVVWNYPPIWSSDSTKLLLNQQEDQNPSSGSHQYDLLKSNVVEYSFITDSSRKVTNFIQKRVLHPNYSSDGQGIVFISNQSGYDEVWIEKNSESLQLTNDREEKRYPIIP